MQIDKRFIIAGVLLAVVIAAVLVYKQIAKSASRYRGKDVATVKATGGTTSTSVFTKGDRWPVEFGVSGSKALMVQKELNKRNTQVKLAEDGKFGALSVAELAAQTGLKSISEAEFQRRYKSPNATTEVNANTSPVIYPPDLHGLMIDVKTDLDLTYFAGRTSSIKCWKDLDLLNNADLGKVADNFKSTYAKPLYVAIDAARFAPWESVDVRILNKLTAIGRTN